MSPAIASHSVVSVQVVNLILLDTSLVRSGFWFIEASEFHPTSAAERFLAACLVRFTMLGSEEAGRKTATSKASDTRNQKTPEHKMGSIMYNLYMILNLMYFQENRECTYAYACICVCLWFCFQTESLANIRIET